MITAKIFDKVSKDHIGYIAFPVSTIGEAMAEAVKSSSIQYNAFISLDGLIFLRDKEDGDIWVFPGGDINNFNIDSMISVDEISIKK